MATRECWKDALPRLQTTSYKRVLEGCIAETADDGYKRVLEGCIAETADN